MENKNLILISEQQNEHQESSWNYDKNNKDNHLDKIVNSGDQNANEDNYRPNNCILLMLGMIIFSLCFIGYRYAQLTNIDIDKIGQRIELSQIKSQLVQLKDDFKNVNLNKQITQLQIKQGQKHEVSQKNDKKLQVEEKKIYQIIQDQQNIQNQIKNQNQINTLNEINKQTQINRQTDINHNEKQKQTGNNQQKQQRQQIQQNDDEGNSDVDIKQQDLNDNKPGIVDIQEMLQTNPKTQTNNNDQTTKNRQTSNRQTSISINNNDNDNNNNIDKTNINNDIHMHDNINDKHSKKQYKQSQLQLFADPILNVRDRIANNFHMPFEETIYIKEGTNIIPDQFYKAKERMNLWKYFNPKTKKIQYLTQQFTDIDKLSKPEEQSKLQLSHMQNVVKTQFQQFQQKYQISSFKQIPFCLIVPTYKNAEKYFRNLNSIFMQDYSNFHVIFIDDASNDGTDELVKNYIKKYQIPQRKITLIVNKENKRALPNIDNAARNYCKSGQIMAIIDGDDYLIGRQVFKVINAEYQKKKLLALYTNHLRIHQPIYLKVGTCIGYPQKVQKFRSYRYYSVFPASHLRTFYVDLYWRIKMRDLKDIHGQYFTAANDFAIMMPVLEMAGKRMEYLPELTYVYDSGTGNNNFQTKNKIQAKNYKITKRRHKYPKLIDNIQFATIMKNQQSINTKTQSNQNIMIIQIDPLQNPIS